jgi:hypothetical protein
VPPVALLLVVLVPFAILAIRDRLDLSGKETENEFGIKNVCIELTLLFFAR